MTEINDIKQAIEDYANGKTANFSNKQFIKWLSSLITTIESQKEEIENQKSINHNQRTEMGDRILRDAREIKDLHQQIESLKAITELAVKENEQLKQMLVDTYGFGWKIEFDRRISNEQT